jgi:hypothetical protein
LKGRNFPRLFTYLIAEGAIVGYALLLAFIFRTSKIDNYDTNGKWRVRWYEILFPSIGLIISVLLATASIVVFFLIEQDIEDHPIYPVEHFLVHAGGALAFGVAMIVVIGTCALKPKRPPKKVRKYNFDSYVNEHIKTSVNPQKKPLPWFTVFIAYPLAWIYIGVASWVSIMFAQKFADNLHPDKDTNTSNWMLSTFVSVLSSIFLTNPLNIIAQVLLISVSTAAISYLFVD